MTKKKIDLYLRNKYKFNKNYPIKKLTTIGLGGIADYVVYPLNIRELIDLILYCRTNKIRYELIGNGSNVLYSDRHFKGIIISINYLTKLYRKVDELYVMCGVKLPYLSYYAYQHSYVNFESFSLIPGSVGASVSINAGAYGRCIGDNIKSVVVLDKNNKIKVLKKEEIIFKYRGSSLMENNYIILFACFNLEEGNKLEIKSKMDLYSKLRIESQPLYERNFGSLFKNHETKKAYKIIKECQLEEFTYKGVKLSKKHLNFLQISTNNSAKDVLYFIEKLREKVYNKVGLVLDNEVILVNWREKDVKRIKRKFK